MADQAFFGAGAISPRSSTFWDEEDCLGFSVFVAELELLADAKSLRPVSQAELLQLLQKLLATIGRTDKAALKAHQPRCEQVLSGLLARGMSAPVRQLIYACLGDFYTYADSIAIYSRISSLQATLSAKPGSRDAAPSSFQVRQGLFGLLAHLHRNHGRQLGAAAPESMALAAKHSAAGSGVSSGASDPRTRLAAMQLAAAVVEGLHPLDRNTADVQGEAVRLFERTLKDRTADSSLRIAAFKLLAAAAQAGGVCFWALPNGSGMFEDAARACVAALEEPAADTASSAALALGELAACVRHAACKLHAKDEKKPPKQKAGVQRVLDTAVHMCLKVPLMEAATAGKPALARLMAVAWCRYTSALLQRYDLGQSGLMDLVRDFIDCLSSAHGALGTAAASAKGGAAAVALATEAAAAAELPEAQAAFIAYLQGAVLDHLTEAGCRLLLDRLTQLAATSRIPPPVVCVAVHALSLVISKLGELPEELGWAVMQAVMPRVVVRSSLLRQQAMAALAALAVAQPACISSLLSQSLRYLQEGVATLKKGASASAAGGGGGAKAAASGAADEGVEVLQGLSLAAATVLQASSHTPFGIPSQLLEDAYSLAVTLVLTPACSGADARAGEKEAGFTLLGAVCRSMHPEVLKGKQEEIIGQLLTPSAVADLFPESPTASSTAASASAAASSSRADNKRGRRGGGAAAAAAAAAMAPSKGPFTAAAAALQAAHAYLTHVILPGHSADGDRHSRALAQLLGHLLVESTSHAPDVASAPPAVATAAVVLQLRLLQAFALLPEGALFANGLAVSALTRLCMGVFGPPGPRKLCSVDWVPLPLLTALLNRQVNAQDGVLDPSLAPSRQDGLMGPEAPGPMFTATSSPSTLPHALQYALYFPGLSATSSHAPDTVESSASGEGSGGAAWAPGGLDAACAGNADGGATLEAARAALLSAQMQALGSLLACGPPGLQLQVLDMLQGLLQPPLQGTRLAGQPVAGCTLPVAVAACTILMAGFGSHARPAPRRGGAEEAETGRHLAERLLAAAVSAAAPATALAAAAAADGGAAACAATAVLRSAAELMGAAARVGGAAYALQLSRKLSRDVTDSLEQSSLASRSMLCLAMGCLVRSLGSLGLHAVVPYVCDALMAAAARPAGRSHFWALHALWLLAIHAGLAFMPQVRRTLALATELVVSSAGEDPGLKPACSRLANAMVAVLGPEFRLGSLEYRQCKALVTPVGSSSGSSSSSSGGVGGDSSGGGGGGDGGLGALQAAAAAAAPQARPASALAGLETVLFAQQLILFAPHAIPPAKHIPLLLGTLAATGDAALRRAAASTLRHLAEKGPEAIMAVRIEWQLLQALDKENNAHIAHQLRATVERLLDTGAAAAPDYWLQLLGRIVFAAAAHAAPNGATNGDDSVMSSRRTRDSIRSDYTEDMDDVEAQGQSDGGASAAVAAAGAAAAAKAGSGGSAYKLQTRLFAAACLLRLVELAEPSSDAGGGGGGGLVISSGGRDGGESGADKDGAGDGAWLLGHMQQVVDLGFRLSTGPLEALRPWGVQLLRAVIRQFHAAPDPLAPGCRLLEQYQAQYVSALRCALAPGSSPALSIAGSSLATLLLESGLTAGDAVVMRRLLDMLTTPLASWASGPAAPGTVLGKGVEGSARYISATKGSVASYDVFSEWVGVQAKLALLQDHAHCLSIGLRDARCAEVVRRAQQAHMPLLLALWAALLQDFWLLTTQPPQVVQLHVSALYGRSQPVLLQAVLPAYAHAWPAVLEALTYGLARAAADSAWTPSQPPSPMKGDAGSQDGRGSQGSQESKGSQGSQDGKPAKAAASIQNAVEAAKGFAGMDNAGPVFMRLHGRLLHAWVLDLCLAMLAAAAAAPPSLDGGAIARGGERRARRTTTSTGGGEPTIAATAMAEALPANSLPLLLQCLRRMLQHAMAASAPAAPPQLSELLQSLLALLRNVSAGAGAGAAAAAGAASAGALTVAQPAALQAVAELLKDVAMGLPAPALQGNQEQQQPAILPLVMDCLSAATTLAVGAARYRPGAALDGPHAYVALLVATQLLLKQTQAAGLDRLPGLGSSSATDGAGAGPSCAEACLHMACRLLTSEGPAGGVALSATVKFFRGVLTLACSEPPAGQGHSTTGSDAGPAPVLAAAAAALAAVADHLLLPLDWPEALAGQEEELQLWGQKLAALCCAIPTLTLATSASAAPNDAGPAAAAAKEVARAALQLMAQALQAGCSGAGSSAVVGLAARVVAAVMAVLADAAAEAPPNAAGSGSELSRARAAWAQTCVAGLAPGMAAWLHGAAGGGKEGNKPLHPSAAACAGEMLRCLALAACLAAARQEAAAAEGLLRVLTPLLVEAVAAPSPAPGPGAAMPALRSAALGLLSSLPSGPAAGAFTAVLASLGASQKARLQAALQEEQQQAGVAAAASFPASAPIDAPHRWVRSASEPVAGGSNGGAPVAVAFEATQAGGGSGRRTAPSIALKTSFAVPAPPAAGK